MRADMPVPALIRPIVSAVLAYIEGGVRPEFKGLEEQLFTQLRSHSPLYEDGEMIEATP